MKHHTRKLLALVLTICMLLSLAAPAAAAPAGKVTFTKVDNSAVTAGLLTKADSELHPMEEYIDADSVRVSIFLEDKSTIMAGYSTESIAANSQAMAYRADLKAKQAQITAAIEKALGEELDVVWNLTLAANIISANVKYGQIEAIEAVDGVSEVLIETLYEPDVVKTEEKADPNMSTSSAQIGSPAAWAAGYTGLGSRIAVIDTGADIHHQSLNPDAFQYSLAFAAGKSGMTMEEYAEQLDLLDAEEIASLREDLNAPVGAEAYINAKIPFGYNYVDGNLDVTHLNDAQGEHGSHVSGIATANSYLYTDEGFVSALDTAMVQGVAPDAQLITMKVFGKSGGAYDSDYMAAIEDAVVLGCDAANLSLGSGNPGTSRCATAAYQDIMESLTKAGIVVAMSAGNSGSWVENAYNLGYLYAEDVSMQTNGSPGSYTNSLSVASVDNDGSTGYFISVGDLMVVYNEMLEGASGAYTNEPFTTIAGEQEYVLIDGVGTPEDFAAVGDALVGKIALCSRGETSFFEKATAAVDAGAIATFIYNNQPGVINMDLTDYKYTNPCASLTQADGLSIKAASTPVTDESGSVLYYTGTMTVSDSMGAGQFNSPYYTMSAFSSWGVPGSLEMKPEITAPGGSIYSIAGANFDGKNVLFGDNASYEVMSGTSMASPQVAGMAAIVAQYIRENGLEEQTGLSARHLAQSLLMSTAEPMLADAASYYSILQQGAGLANVGAAVTADSYIIMADGTSSGAADGKVKVELGDDPDRTGAYSATFTINNLTDVDKAFDLGADFFIQAPTSDGVDMYMYTATALIGADVTWTVDGIEVAPDGSYAGLDFNGDGAVNSDDGQAILDYATGVNETLTNLAKADLDTDGDVDSYDAYLFLKELNASVALVPANGSAEVTVNFSLSDDWKETLDYYYPNGTYLQGYIYVQSLSDAEGVAGTSHSIPVLGFFGNWTDPSMFDVGSYPEYETGDETRVPYLGKPDANTFTVSYANDFGVNYYFGGNPMVPDETYMPERNAFNGINGDMISSLLVTVIRNAAASRFTIVNETTGETLVESFPGPVSSAYYYVNGGYWNYTSSRLNLGFIPEGIAAEDDVLVAALTLAPEYYVDAEGSVDWDALGEGASFSIPMVIDNTAPEIEDISMSLTRKTLTVTAADNQYVSAVALYNKSGSTVYAYTGAKQDIAPGESAAYELDLSGVSGSNFLVQVTDYAMNTSTYAIELGLGEDESVLPDFIAYNLSYNDIYWTSFSKDSNYTELLDTYAPADHVYFAGTIVDHYVFAATEEGELHVMPETDLTDITVIADLGLVLLDMAYNENDGKIYAVDEYGWLVSIDKLTGELADVGEIGVETNTLACDENGTFYCNEIGTGAVYSFTLDTIDNPEILCADVGIDSQYVQAMEINPNDGKLYWSSYYYFEIWPGFGTGYGYLYEIDTKTGEFINCGDKYYELSALLIPDKSSNGSWADPTDDVLSITVTPAELGLVKGSSAQLTAAVMPWTATDRTVTWTTADETIATVNSKGMVTAVAEGTTTITATSNLDPSFTASCTVTVSALDVTLSGALQDAEGNPMFYTWNMAEEDTWTGGVAIDTSMTSATIDTLNNKAYIMDANPNSWSMHLIDPTTGESEEVGANAAGVPLWDMEYSTVFSTAENPLLNGIYYYYFLPAKDPMALDTSAFGLSSYMAQYSGASYLVAITSAGYERTQNNAGDWLDTEHVLMLDNAGYIWDFWIYPADGGYSALLNFAPTNLSSYGLEFPGNQDDMYTSMVVGEDGNLYLSAYTGDYNELFQLVYDNATGTYSATAIGNFGADVWPAILTSVTSNDGSAADSMVGPKPAMQMDAVTVTAADLAAAAEPTCDTRAQKAGQMAVKAPVEVASDASVADGETTVTVDITADAASTNGVVDISWDTDALELVEYASTAAYTSSVEDEGKLTFGYVSLAPVEAGDSIVTLTFNVLKTEDTTVSVSHKQLNNTAGTTEEILVEFEHANTEIRDAIAATCTTAGYTGDTYCTDCGKLIAKGTIIEAHGHSYDAVVTEPTCTEDGYTTYTCSRCGESYVDDYVKSDCACVKFTDVDADDWFHDAVDFVNERGLMNGLSSTIFAPEATMTRAQMVTVLYRLAGAPAVEAPSDFIDVPANSFYANAVAWAVANGITNGVSKTVFNPNGAVTREQMVTFLYRYAKLSGLDVTTTSDLSAYTDAADVSGWAVEAMIWAVENGIITGMTADTLVPTDATTRAQVATVLMRFAK